ncbi:hypothetical protein CR513_57592, partial [Mucuna pruriens]
MSYLFALMAKTTLLGHSNSRYLSEGNIYAIMLMAILLSLTETKITLSMPNGKSKMHKSWPRRFQLKHNITTFKWIVFGLISCIETLYHHWMHVSMIYYMKNNALLHSPSLKNISHPLFLWHICSKKFCYYCKKDGHTIKECPTRPQRRTATAFTASVDSSILDSFPNPTPIQQNTPTNVPTLTLEMVQQMIISAFSTLGFSSKSSSPWYFDHGLPTT